ncbi:MAG: hypothetical protein JO257_32520 [Deltaproteobacteria bacterium]|nr:hypothetical protein [Deltaproteobacteria bacterium]
MSVPLALGFALHHDHVLADDPSPLEALIVALCAELPADQLRNFFVPDGTQKAAPPSAFDRWKLIERVRSGGTWLASVQSAPGTADHAQIEISAGTVGADRASRSLTKCRYAVWGALGAEPLHHIRAQRAVDAIVAFADAVAVRAGVMHWATTTVYASCLSAGANSSQLSRDENRHVTDLMYWQPRWGLVIRGPQWGTFLGVEHVRTLGGIEKIIAESRCARVVPLASGGAFLQATPLERPIVEGSASDELARIAAYLAPVTGQR